MHPCQPDIPAPGDDKKHKNKPADDTGKTTEEATLKNMMMFMETLLKEIEKDEQKNSSDKKS